MTKPSGYVIYEGPSLLDGSPIVVIATLKSTNDKTRNMLQTWIIRSDVSPMEANRKGLDFSVCGNCPSRGKPTDRDNGLATERSCYVKLHQAPTGIYKAFKRRRYPLASGHAAIASVGRGRKVRLGAYGDMSAVPSYVATSLISEADGHTAYSHQSGMAGSSYDPSLYMVSADSLDDARAAWATGARTFRVVSDYSEMVAEQEIPCPSMHGVHCITCGLCNGTGKAKKRRKVKSIVIKVHGAGAKHHVAA